MLLTISCPWASNQTILHLGVQPSRAQARLLLSDGLLPTVSRGNGHDLAWEEVRRGYRIHLQGDSSTGSGAARSLKYDTVKEVLPIPLLPPAASSAVALDNINERLDGDANLGRSSPRVPNPPSRGLVYRLRCGAKSQVRGKLGSNSRQNSNQTILHLGVQPSRAQARLLLSDGLLPTVSSNLACALDGCTPKCNIV
jgi:hypothetical protein